MTDEAWSCSTVDASAPGRARCRRGPRARRPAAECPSSWSACRPMVRRRRSSSPWTRARAGCTSRSSSARRRHPATDVTSALVPLDAEPLFRARTVDGRPQRRRAVDGRVRGRAVGRQGHGARCGAARRRRTLADRHPAGHRLRPRRAGARRDPGRAPLAAAAGDHRRADQAAQPGRVRAPGHRAAGPPRPGGPHGVPDGHRPRPLQGRQRHRRPRRRRPCPRRCRPAPPPGRARLRPRRPVGRRRVRRADARRRRRQGGAGAGGDDRQRAGRHPRHRPVRASKRASAQRCSRPTAAGSTTSCARPTGRCTRPRSRARGITSPTTCPTPPRCRATTEPDGSPRPASTMPRRAWQRRSAQRR